MAVLKKLISIRRVGRFLNFSAKDDIQFRKVTLLYGENGKGKTTLGAIFRSLQLNDPGPVLGRKTVGESAKPEVTVLTDTAKVTFTGTSWTKAIPELAVFDQFYISENVYAGDLISASQKRNLYRVIIGEKGVRLAQELDELSKANRALASEIKATERAITPHLAPGMKMPEFIALEAPKGIDEAIAQAQRQLRDASDTTAIATKPRLKRISAFSEVLDLSDILSKSLPDLEADAEARVRDHLEKHAMARSDQEWLQRGLEYPLDDSCPFCGQDVSGLDLIRAYKTLFSAAYRDLRSEINEYGVRTKTDLTNAIDQLRKDAAANTGSWAYWSERSDLGSSLALDIDAYALVYGAYGELVLAALRQKSAAPLDPIAVSAEIADAASAVAAYREEVEAYNQSVATANEKIEVYRRSVTGQDISAIQNELTHLEAFKARSKPEISRLCDEYMEQKTQHAEGKQKAEELKSSIDAEGEKSKQYEQKINAHLDRFAASFRIGNVKHNYVGGVNADFNIVIRDHSIALGSEKTPDDEPSFKNTLSAGDRSTLALALFLIHLEADAERSKRVVVLDDPFNSQDRFRRNQTAIEIAELAKTVAQVIVLSHDAGFLADVGAKLVDTPCKELRLVPVGQHESHITECSLEGLLRQPLRAWIDILQQYYRVGSSSGRPPEDVVQKIRPLLEAHCNNVCPTRFEDADHLSSMIGKVRAAGDDHPLSRLLKELSDIHDFSKRHHHDDNSVHGPIDETELSTYVRRTLRVVNAL